MEIIFSDSFLARLEDYSLIIAGDNPRAASLWVDEVFARCTQLNRHPYSGREFLEASRPDIRELIFGRYRIIYKIEKNHIEVLTLMHTRQSPPEIADL